MVGKVHNSLLKRFSYLRFVTFVDEFGRERLGALVNEKTIVDINLAYMLLMRSDGEPIPQSIADARVPPTVLEFLRTGQAAIKAAKEAFGYAKSVLATEGAKQSLGFRDLRTAKLLAPVPRPGKMICLGENFVEHAKEADRPLPAFPRGFFKAGTAITGPYDDIIYPKYVTQLDYEVEVAAVVGKRVKHVAKDRALECVAGYTVFNDVSARDVQFKEMATGMLLLGKNFDTLGPMGPHLVLVDEVEDPQNLEMTLLVNGDVRQRSNTRHMYFKFSDLIEYFSRITLEPGDIISSGTPPGVAIGRKPDPTPYLLKPGDVVEAAVTGLGTIRNRVVSEP